METIDTKKEHAIQRRVYNTLLNLSLLPKVLMQTYKNESGSITYISIEHDQEYVPNLILKWCSVRKHYRVYIHVASTIMSKVNAGYCICTIGSGLTASGLVMFYGFLHKNRANNRSEAKE